MQERERLREEQVAQVVAEVTRLAQQREEGQLQSLERDQVEQILQELNLPTDLIDDALAQLRRKEALAKEQRRKRLIIAGSVLGVILLVALVFWWNAQRNAVFARISGETGRITRAVDNGSNLQTVTRDGQDVVYHVTLNNVPAGEQLEMRCNWIAPDGQIFKQNHWQTRVTDKSVWLTSCKCQLGPAAASGTWKVEMLLGDRTVSATSFQVE